MKINSKLYDILKYLALIGLPAFGSFWMVVGVIWGLAYTDEIVKTVVACATLLGALLVLNQVRYNSSDAKYDGHIIPLAADLQTSDKALTLNENPQDVRKSELLLKVNPVRYPE